MNLTTNQMTPYWHGTARKVNRSAKRLAFIRSIGDDWYVPARCLAFRPMPHVQHPLV